MKPELTRQQQHVLDYARVFFSMNDALPSAKTIARAFGYASGNAASEILLRLAKCGAIEKNESGGYRFPRAKDASCGQVRRAMLRAADFVGSEMSIDTAEANQIAATLRTVALRMPQS